ncbi:hypothetical protein ACUNB3_001131 [Vibrio alginolyticus]
MEIVLDDPILALDYIARLISLAVVISSSELLVLNKKGEFSTTGAWSWAVVSASVGPRLDTLNFLYSNKYSFPTLIWFRLTLSILIIFLGLEAAVSPVIVLSLFTVQLLLNMRIIWGDDGSDQMLSICLGALLFTSIFNTNENIKVLCLGFVAAQLALSYFSSGAAKLFGKEWRNGTALSKVLSHYSYGNENLSNILSQHPLVGKFASYGVMVFQLSFPLYFVLPYDLAVIYLIMGFFFHFSIACIMRLNGFLFTFCAGYPALIYMYFFIHQGSSFKLW